MRTFVWTMLILLALEATGNAVMIWKQEFKRTPALMVVDIAIAIVLIAWAAWLLGHEA